MMEVPKGLRAYLVAQLAATYTDVMEKMTPGFSIDIDGAFLAAEEFVKQTLPSDLQCPNNREAVARAVRAREAKKRRANIKAV